MGVEGVNDATLPGMHVAFDLDVDIRCVGCEAERPFPSPAERVLEGDVLYADVPEAEACPCGSRRVRVDVKFDAEEVEPESGAEPRHCR